MTYEAIIKHTQTLKNTSAQNNHLLTQKNTPNTQQRLNQLTMTDVSIPSVNIRGLTDKKMTALTTYNDTKIAPQDKPERLTLSYSQRQNPHQPKDTITLLEQDGLSTSSTEIQTAQISQMAD
jgi:hypothetical protein